MNNISLESELRELRKMTPPPSKDPFWRNVIILLIITVIALTYLAIETWKANRYYDDGRWDYLNGYLIEK